MQPKLLYVSFDIVPSPKGAAVHIEQFAKAIAKEFDALQLVTVAPNVTDGQILERDFAPGIKQIELPAPGRNLIDRINSFRRFLESWWKNQHFDIVHFRSPFEGYPLAIQKLTRAEKIIFEVNGLPSIELKYRYPNIADDVVLLEKILGQESICLQAADLIITPSKVTADFLQIREGVSDGAPASSLLLANKIKVIRNGVDLEIFKYDPFKSAHTESTLRLLYFGTLTAWQGVDLAVSTASLLRSELPEKQIQLKIIGAGKQQQVEALNELIARLNVNDIVSIEQPCSQKELVKHIHDSHIVLAPLTANDRNMVQGCCPFKIIESMACGRPVISTDLPVVQEIQSSTQEALFLAKPGSSGSLRDAIIAALANPEETERKVKLARQIIESNYNLEITAELLCSAYKELLSTRLSNASN